MQGRISQTTGRLIASTIAVCCVLLASADAQEPMSVRLALRWGDGAPRQWIGAVGPDRGVVANTTSLAVDADQPGSHWIDRGHLVFHQRRPKAYDGVEFTVHADEDASLQIRVRSDDGRSQPVAIDVPLRELLTSRTQIPLDEFGNRLSVERCPADMLRVFFDRDHLVFSPGEQLRFELEPRQLPVEKGELVDIALELRRARTEETLWKSEHRIAADNTNASRHETPLPDVEGVYELVITASYNPGLNWQQMARPSWNWRQTLAVRRIQCVVLSTRPTEAPDGVDQGLELLETIDPTDPTGWNERWKRWTTLPQSAPRLPSRFPSLTQRWGEWPDRLPSLTSSMPDIGDTMPRLGAGFNNRIPSLSSWSSLWTSSTVGSGHLAPYEGLPRGLVRLPSNREAGETTWQAYPIPVRLIGKPHVLELEYLDTPQTIHLSIVEPNVMGAMTERSLDFGVDVSERLVQQATPTVPEVKKYRVVFWPKTDAPLILIANGRDDREALFGKIRLYGGWDHLPRRFPAGDPPGRLVAAYLDRPVFPECFSASRTIGTLTDAPVDDWVTFYDGGVRMVEYLRHAGYNGLMMSVLSDGSAIYPSRTIEATALHDSGAFLGAGRDPMRKDVVEMLARMFDRDRLQLIPALDFGSPLPELEAVLRRGGPESVGIRLIGPNGQPCPIADAGPSILGDSPKGRAPYYNILHPRVQDVMLATVREVVGRYGRHRSFQGLALQLEPDGYAMLPGPAWGIDDETIASFERETGIQVPGEGPDRYRRRAEFLEQQCPQRWLQWRAIKIRAFHDRVRAVLVAARPDARLYLAGASMLSGESTRYHLRPRLPQEMTVTEAMLRLGVNPSLYDGQSQIVLLQPERVAPLWSLPREAVALEMERLPDIDSAFVRDGAPTGALCFRPERTEYLPSFTQASPARFANGRIQPAPLPSGDEGRRRFAHAMAAVDALAVFDGGSRIRTEQDDEAAAAMRTIRRLPDLRFERWVAADKEKTIQPLCLRTARGVDGVYAYVVNDAPFIAYATVRVATRAGCRIEELTGLRPIKPPKADNRGLSWTVALAPYEILPVRLSDPGARIYDVETVVPANVTQQLATAIDDLSNRVAASGAMGLPWTVPHNSDFEASTANENMVPGWTPLSTRTTTVTTNLRDSFDAERGRSLKIASNGPGGSVLSDPFPCPCTGRLAVFAWIGSPANDTAPSPLRLAVQDIDGRTLYAMAPGKANGEGVTRDGVQWRRVLFAINELPLDAERGLRLRFDMIAPGTVLVDDVELYGIAFSRNERIKLMGLVGLADHCLQKGRVFDALRLLESYWPRFLLTHVEPAPPQPEPSVAPAPETREAKREDDRGFFGRMRSYIPSGMQIF